MCARLAYGSWYTRIVDLIALSACAKQQYARKAQPSLTSSTGKDCAGAVTYSAGNRTLLRKSGSASVGSLGNRGSLGGALHTICKSTDIEVSR
jgi:hypothetical protein